MLEYMKRIGIFMIAAQTVIHFAAGKQYEKYMKMIAGVIVLLMFIAPFVSSSGDIMQRWQAQSEQMARQMERQAQEWQEDVPYMSGHASDTALQQIEEEIKSRLNRVIGDEGVRVTDVIIDLDRQGGQGNIPAEYEETEPIFRCVKVVLWEQAADKEEEADSAGRMISIEKITVGQGGTKDTEQDRAEDKSASIQEYRKLFAQALGIAEDKVEVSYGGGR